MQETIFHLHRLYDFLHEWYGKYDSNPMFDTKHTIFLLQSIYDGLPIGLFVRSGFEIADGRLRLNSLWWVLVKGCGFYFDLNSKEFTCAFTEDSLPMEALFDDTIWDNLLQNAYWAKVKTKVNIARDLRTRFIDYLIPMMFVRADTDKIQAWKQHLNL